MYCTYLWYKYIHTYLHATLYYYCNYNTEYVCTYIHTWLKEAEAPYLLTCPLIIYNCFPTFFFFFDLDFPICLFGSSKTQKIYIYINMWERKKNLQSIH